VSDETVEVGRANASVRISLTDPSVSRRHARITFANGGFLVEDLASSNHTFVNDREISTPTVIGDGDRLGFGDVVVEARVRQPANSSQDSPGYASIDDGPGRTLAFVPEEVARPTSLPDARRPAARVIDPEATMNEAASAQRRPSRPVPVEPASVSEASRRSIAAPVVIKPTTSRRRPASEPSDRGMADLSTDLQAVIAQIRRVEADPGNADEFDALVELLPTARRLLETELDLLNVLTRARSDALG